MMIVKCPVFVSLAVGLAAISSTNADILIDFNDLATSPSRGGLWNVIAAPRTDSTPLFDTAGADTGVRIRFNDGWLESDLDEIWPHGNKDWIDANSTADAFAISIGDEPVSITYSGLDPDLMYRIDHLAVRDGSTDPVADYTIEGNFADSTPNGDDFNVVTDGFENGSVLTWNHVLPNEQGEIILQIADGAFGYASAGRILVPEPATGGLTILGVLSLGCIAWPRFRRA